MSDWVATTRSAWGRAYSEYGAVAEALARSSLERERSHGDHDDVDLWTYEVDGFEDVWPGDGGIKADTVERATYYTLDYDLALEVKGLAEEVDLVVDDALAQADARDIPE